MSLTSILSQVPPVEFPFIPDLRPLAQLQWQFPDPRANDEPEFDMNVLLEFRACFFELTYAFGYLEKEPLHITLHQHFEQLSHLYPLGTSFQHAITDPFFRTLSNRGSKQADMTRFNNCTDILTWIQICKIDACRFPTMQLFLRQLLCANDAIKQKLFKAYLQMPHAHSQTRTHVFFHFYYVMMLLIAFKFKDVGEFENWVYINTFETPKP